MIGPLHAFDARRYFLAVLRVALRAVLRRAGLRAAEVFLAAFFLPRLAVDFFARFAVFFAAFFAVFFFAALLRVVFFAAGFFAALRVDFLADLRAAFFFGGTRPHLLRQYTPHDL